MTPLRRSGPRGLPGAVRLARAVAATVIAGAFASSIACTHGQPSTSSSGALDIVLQSDMALPKDMDHVSLQVTQHGRSLLATESDLGAGHLLLPATFEVRATSDASPVTIQAVGSLNHVPKVERDAITPIPTGETGVLGIRLDYLCVGTAQADADGGVSSTCPDGMTCSNGSCVSALVPAADVSVAGPVDASMDAAASTCFDVATCFGAATAAVVDPASCVVTLPPGTDPAKANVALQFLPSGPGVCTAAACWVSLTGWTPNGTSIPLPAAACKDAAAQGASIVVSTSCFTQGDGQAICGGWSSATTPTTEPPAGPVQSCGSDTQPCGHCGTQTRSCTDGVDGPWGACTGEGPCMPGDSQACGSGGTQACGDDCQWAACGCSADQLACGAPGTCASPADVRTCGTCANDCTALPHVSGATTCNTGTCAFPASSCAAGWADCDGDPTNGCESPLNTTTHCGACATACTGVDALCDSAATPAKCGTSCTGSICNAACVNESTDPMHCGGCSGVCATPLHGQAACAGAKCGVACNSGYTACPSATPTGCVDTTSDAANCGACGHACATGVACKKGVCQCTAAASQSCGTCGTGTQTSTCNADGTVTWSACTPGANLQTDPANCGSCGHGCTTGESCQGGLCTCPTTDPSSRSCGNCGNETRTCNDGVWSAWSTTCAGQGVCAPSASQSCEGLGTETCGTSCTWGGCTCNAPDTLCSGQCVNEQTDSNNCGGCGTYYACATGQTCQSGQCKCAPGTQNCGGKCLAQCPTPTATCYDPSTGLTWGSTGSSVLNESAAGQVCASYGGTWHLPSYTEIHEWPWSSAGQLQTTPSAGTTCVLTFPVKQPDNGDDPGANEDFVWVAALCSGGVHGSSTCGTNTFCQGDLVTGYVPLTSCPGDANAIALCVE